MSPCDYDLLTKEKEPLRRTRYNTRDELIRALGRSIRNINKDARADGVQLAKWIAGQCKQTNDNTAYLLHTVYLCRTVYIDHLSISLTVRRLPNIWQAVIDVYKGGAYIEGT